MHLPPDTMTSQNSYLCDTLLQAKLAQTSASHPSRSSHDPTHTNEQPPTSDNLRTDPPDDVHPIPGPSQRKLCPRHKRMADEGTNLKLQQVRYCHIANVYVLLTHTPSRPWMLSLCRSGRPSAPSGQISRPHPILGAP